MNQPSKPSLAPWTRCHSGVTGMPLDHDGTGWICAPDGKRISAMCQEHAYEVIHEYAEKLGEQWTWESADSGNHYTPMARS